jgi:YihY family inner membrane protein
LMGQQTAQVLQSAVQSAAHKSSGVLATIIGIATLIVTASGVFGEMQTALNKIWKAKPKGTTVSRLIRARAASLGLVAAMGFLLMVSLVVSTALTAFGGYLNAILPFGKIILSVLNFVVSLLLISFLFAAIYKILPDRNLEWNDVAFGAIVTAILFSIGKSLISRYIGSSSVASSFGAASALIILCCGFIIPLKFFCSEQSSQRSTPIDTAAGGRSWLRSSNEDHLSWCAKANRDPDRLQVKANWRGLKGPEVAANLRNRKAKAAFFTDICEHWPASLRAIMRLRITH